MRGFPVGQVVNLPRIGNPPAAIALLAAILLAPLSAQTLDQAESLWKARRYSDANEVFKVLVAKEPKNADYRVRWGRMYLEHWQPDIASDLFKEALDEFRTSYVLTFTPRGVKTEGAMAPEIDLSKQRPAEFVFSRHVEKKMSEIRTGRSNTTETDTQEIAAAE